MIGLTITHVLGDITTTLPNRKKPRGPREAFISSPTAVGSPAVIRCMSAESLLGLNDSGQLTLKGAGWDAPRTYLGWGNAPHEGSAWGADSAIE